MKSEVTVESLALYINRGITPKYTEVIDDSVIVLNQKCIRDFKVSLEPSRRNDLSKRKITEGKMLKKHDVLINSTGVGTLGRVAQYFGADDDATVDSHVTIVRPNPELVDPIYFGYLMKSKQSLIESFAEGTTGQTELNRNSVKELLLEIVNDIPTQKIIGGILLEIDQKLELNTQTNQTLEQIAQAIFKSWFVDFDPVKAKIETLAAGGNADDAELAAMGVISAKTLDELNSLKASNPEQFNKLAQTATLFPEKLVESELGLIPESWGAKPLGDYLTIKRGGSPRPIKDFIVPEGYPWTKIADATANDNPYIFNTKEFIKEEGLKKTVYLEKGTLILSNSATPGLPRFLELDACIHDGWLHFPEKTHFTDSYLYQLFLHIRNHLVAQGNGSVFTNLKTDILRNQVVLVPPKELVDVYDKHAAKLLETVKAKSIENNQLAQLRDTLLPKLLSGEIDLTSEVVA
ncbi:restriction endonuclease subunit S [Vibrio cholerae]|uniref:restriction endonuclease subunit S n=1 Tax=Vibrio cholerae TaxID=666 RepID=UPI0004E3CA99|nr:restriction endonuclease subunit S [Vibrio cholerae]EGR1090068.1 restriction endonuclease subunit S [Vibrio cholerae]EGR4197290.1 restriction endonuclease subunit S [Vibrio cholerae]KFE22814.1 type I restriction modification DNA specificity domain protein [Vibrio cholerae]TXZ29112.1 restriction endonuclease subunit S [Vibrio cholerae]BCK27965.1 hypothetical protein VCSRO77_1329 [Vibrio cholerae]